MPQQKDFFAENLTFRGPFKGSQLNLQGEKIERADLPLEKWRFLKSQSGRFCARGVRTGRHGRATRNSKGNSERLRGDCGRKMAKCLGKTGRHPLFWSTGGWHVFDTSASSGSCVDQNPRPLSYFGTQVGRCTFLIHAKGDVRGGLVLSKYDRGRGFWKTRM